MPLGGQEKGGKRSPGSSVFKYVKKKRKKPEKTAPDHRPPFGLARKRKSGGAAGAVPDWLEEKKKIREGRLCGSTQRGEKRRTTLFIFP